MRILITLVFTCSLPLMVQSQSVLTLEECYEGAEANYPLSRRRGLIERTEAFSVENAAKARLPQFQIAGQATYQSDVTRIPFEMPGIEPPSNDQYRIFGEIAQVVYQGGIISLEQKSAALNTEVESKDLEVELYALKGRINELFFGILLLQEQQRQHLLVKEDLNSGLKKLRAAIAHGAALPRSADVLQAELLRVDQRMIELKSSEKVYREAMAALVGEPIAEHTVLMKPEFGDPSSVIQRPEQDVFDLRRKRVESSRALLSARKRPRLELFIQGGYGRPGLNMLANKFDFYYLAGVRFAWQLSRYYTSKGENEIFDLQRQSLDLQEETFLFNTRLTLNRHEGEIERLQQLIAVDSAIITLRTRVRETAEVQLEEGIISASDFVREVNAEDQAKQYRALHETQLLMAQANYHFTSGL